MRRAFVVGHPIAHSRSPLIHGHWLARHGISGSYARIDVAPDAFSEFVRGLPGSGFAGGNVTIPHKEAAFALADTLTPRAEKIGAVNTLIVGPDGRISGDNTDAPGFIAHLDQSLSPDWPARTGGSA
ncbi:shikimate dehydrogenase, partial [Methylobacterium trifolii]